MVELVETTDVETTDVEGTDIEGTDLRSLEKRMKVFIFFHFKKFALITRSCAENCATMK